jgi:hypothetical protein
MDRIRDIAAGTPGASGGHDSQLPASGESDVADLAALTTKLLNMVHDNIIARHWSHSGGPNGPLGTARSDVLPAAQGRQYAKFSNGYVYTAADGQVVEVLGTILDRFLQLGADKGVLGLPLRNAYPVPDGLRADFERGSLILNQLTGIVTTVWKTYNDTYQEQMGREPVATQVSAPLPGSAPAPDSAPAHPSAPAHSSAPAHPSAPVLDRAPVPGSTPAPGSAPVPGSTSTPGSTPTPGSAPASGNAPAPGGTPVPGDAPAPAVSVPGSAPAPAVNQVPEARTPLPRPPAPAGTPIPIGPAPANTQDPAGIHTPHGSAPAVTDPAAAAAPASSPSPEG